MKEFFRGWRRKVGCLTLVLACVFMVQWLRGFVVEDLWQPKYGMNVGGWQYAPVSHFFTSSCDGIAWHKSEASDSSNFCWQPGWGTNSLGVAAELEAKIRRNTKWRWSWAGFDSWYSEKDEVRRWRHRIPYWSIVLPLTAIAASLLLSNPQQMIQRPSGPSASIGD